MRTSPFRLRGLPCRLWLAGWLLHLSACDGVSTVAIDVLPGSYPNVVGRDRAWLDLAVLASEAFDPAGLDPDTASVSDSGRTAAVTAGQATAADVNGDGRADRVFRFSVPALLQAGVLNEASTRALFLARGRGLLREQAVEGWDRVVLDADRVAPLPEPTGPHPVGTTSFTFVDPGRPAPPELKHPYRTLVVRAFYPSRAMPSSQPAPYFLDDREAELDARRRRLPSTFFDGAAGWSRKDVPAARAPAHFPVLLFSPGLGAPLAYYQTLLAELSSHGYAVFAIAHPGHAGTVVYPDGQTVVPSFGMDLQRIRALHDQAALDLRALVGWLAGHGASRPLAGRLDLARLGAFGHSLGGSASVDAALSTPEIRIALNLDGQFFGLASAGGPARPVMFIGAEAHNELRDPTLSGFFGNRRDIAYQLNVAGAGHNNCSDWGVLRPLMAEPPPLAMFGLGPIEPRRGQTIINAYARALIDHHLRELPPSPPIDAPDPAFPEVTLRVHPAP